MSLPLLPGNSFNRNLGKDKFHKSHHFDYKNEIGHMFGDDKPGIGRDPLPGQRIAAPHSRYPGGDGGNMPAWVAFDKQVLCFDAYYQEGVQESRDEQFRVHHCKVYFYLEDDSIQVIEPRLKNSGLPQGTTLRRHRVSKPPPNDESYYRVEDFNVGNEITMYGKTYRLTGCDEFTQNFLRKLGVRVGLPEAIPNDPYTNVRKAMDESMQALRPYERHDTLRQFLDHDRHVLRFYCFWDDTDSLYGDPREMVLHYFLADDTIEIREVIPVNCGRDAAPCFLRRQKLPKKIEDLHQPGEVCDRTVLNVFGQIQKGRYILDNLKTGSVHIENYHDSDLTIGSYLNVWGRKFLICDCDEFTKEYYRAKYGINEFSPIAYKKPTGEPLEREDPPYNGWGSQEDSLGNCKGLLPRPPQRDFIKFMEKDKKGLESQTLRFLGRLATDKPIEKDRRFIISYFLSDDTILVFEPPVRNSGILGGKFLERQRIKVPGQERYSTRPPQYYQAQDMFVGNLLEINRFRFYLENADEYAFRYMEANKDEFPMANIERIIGKLKAKASGKGEELRSYFARNDPDGMNSVPCEQLTTLLRQMCAGDLTEHEILTVARYYAVLKKEDVNVSQIVGVAQQLLRKHNFELFTKLREACSQVDRDGSGRLPLEQLRSVARTLRIPLPDDLMRSVISISGMDENGLVDYNTFVMNMNWREHPVAPMGESGCQGDASWSGNTAQKNTVDRIQWTALVNDLCGPPSSD